MLSCFFAGAPKKPPSLPNQATSAAESARFASKRFAAAPKHRSYVNRAKPAPVVNPIDFAPQWTAPIDSALGFSKA